MKSPMTWVERFCYEHPNFGVKNLMLYITVGNVALWLLNAVNPLIIYYCTFDPALILKGQIWRIVTFAFVPDSVGFLALIAYAFYYWMGRTLEEYWGSGQFTIFFFSGVILTELFGFVMYALGFGGAVSTTHYMYLSMLFAFATLYPDMTIMFMYILPIPMKYLAYIDGAYFLWGVIMLPFPQKLLPLVAVLNFFVFCGEELFRSARKYKRSSNAVNFKRESRRIRQEERAKLYNHKCAVCGRTDTDHPELEFRYCSRCAGYHCFCQDHINNHIHFTE